MAAPGPPQYVAALPIGPSPLEAAPGPSRLDLLPRLSLALPPTAANATAGAGNFRLLPRQQLSEHGNDLLNCLLPLMQLLQFPMCNCALAVSQGSEACAYK